MQALQLFLEPCWSVSFPGRWRELMTPWIFQQIVLNFVARSHIDQAQGRRSGGGHMSQREGKE